MNKLVKKKNKYSYISPSHLRAARAWMGWTLDIAVEKLGISRQTLWRYEASKNKISKFSAQKIYVGFRNNGIELKPEGLMIVEQVPTLLRDGHRIDSTIVMDDPRCLVASQ